MKVLASSYGHVAGIAEYIRRIPAEKRPFILAIVYYYDLMRLRQPFQFLISCIRYFGKFYGVYQFFYSMQLKYPEQIEAWVMHTADHVEFGTDTEDCNSVGGWSQRELDLFVKGYVE